MLWIRGGVCLIEAAGWIGNENGGVVGSRTDVTLLLWRASVLSFLACQQRHSSRLPAIIAAPPGAPSGAKDTVLQ